MDRFDIFNFRVGNSIIYERELYSIDLISLDQYDESEPYISLINSTSYKDYIVPHHKSSSQIDLIKLTPDLLKIYGFSVSLGIVYHTYSLENFSLQTNESGFDVVINGVKISPKPIQYLYELENYHVLLTGNRLHSAELSNYVVFKYLKTIQ